MVELMKQAKLGRAASSLVLTEVQQLLKRLKQSQFLGIYPFHPLEPGCQRVNTHMITDIVWTIDIRLANSSGVVFMEG